MCKFDFLIVCGSDSNNKFSQNYIATEYLSEWLEETYDYSVKTIFIGGLKGIPFIDRELLDVKFFPNDLNELFELIFENSKIVFIVPEHNSNLPAHFKNIFDWLTVRKRNLLSGKKVILISASETKKRDRGLKITGRLTFSSVGCFDYHFIDWKGDESAKLFRELMKT